MHGIERERWIAPEAEIPVQRVWRELLRRGNEFGGRRLLHRGNAHDVAAGRETAETVLSAVICRCRLRRGELVRASNEDVDVRANRDVDERRSGLATDGAGDHRGLDHLDSCVAYPLAVRDRDSSRLVVDAADTAPPE